LPGSASRGLGSDARERVVVLGAQEVHGDLDDIVEGGPLRLEHR
jgi:hypothetical protein